MTWWESRPRSKTDAVVGRTMRLAQNHSPAFADPTAISPFEGSGHDGSDRCSAQTWRTAVAFAGQTRFRRGRVHRCSKVPRWLHENRNAFGRDNEYGGP
jgi:hypothetical protein